MSFKVSKLAFIIAALHICGITWFWAFTFGFAIRFVMFCYEFKNEEIPQDLKDHAAKQAYASVDVTSAEYFERYVPKV